MIVDFHSHTNESHDGLKSFTPLKNIRWHVETGHHAGFVTDHNVFSNSAEARRLTVEETVAPGSVSMRGEEVSLRKTHLVVLGNEALIPHEPNNTMGDEGIRNAFEEIRKTPALIALFQITWMYRMNPEKREMLLDLGLHGMEAGNSCPRGMNMTVEDRRELVALCRERNLFMIAASENHGYGRTVYAWNAVRVPGWRKTPPADRERLLLDTMRAKGFEAVRIVARVKAEPRSWMVGSTFDLWRQLWETARTMPASHGAVSIAWFWAAWAVWRILR